MGICYWCYWGWPKPIREIYDRAVNALGCDDALQFGPSHIVWSDENWDSANCCLEHFDEYKGQLSEKELAIVRQSLVELLALPDEYKEPPSGYDEQNPTLFPPPAHWECEKV